MPSYLADVLLEFSPDDLSDASPTYVDVTEYLRGIEWAAGVANELDDPEPGEAIIHLRNDARRFEPEYPAGLHYPNMTTERRWRLTLTDSTGAVQQGVFYSIDFELTYPAGTTYSECVVTCTDGHALLSLDTLDSLDPADAETYGDVVLFDEPWGYWTLGDAPSSATIAAAAGPEGIPRERFTLKRKKRRGRLIPGPAGVVKTRSLLTLGEPGAILGDTDTAAKFATSGASEGHIEIPLPDTETLSAGDTLTVECWAKTTGTDCAFVSGPDSGAGVIWALTIGAIGALGSDTLAFTIEALGGTIQATQATTAANDGAWHHIVGTWTPGVAKLYLDGELVGTATGLPPVLTPAATPKLRIGSLLPADNTGLTGWLDEVAVYETALSAERIAAHYNAGSGGFPEQTAGERIAAVAASDLWSEARIQAGAHDVQPVMEHGQSKLEEIRAAMACERPSSLLFFDGDGDPVYLGWEFKDASPYNTVQATFGDGAGEVGYLAAGGLELDYDNKVYNIVTGSREGGELRSVEDATSIAARKRRVRSDETDLICSDDEDVDAVLGAILARWKDPTIRPVSVTTTGANAGALTHLLRLEIGDLVRLKRRGEGGTAIDRVATILGYRKQLDPSGHLVGTFTLSRGFDAAAGYWQAGITGHSEAGSTTKAK